MAAAQATTTTSLSTGEAFDGLKPFRIYDERDDRHFYGLLDPPLFWLWNKLLVSHPALHGHPKGITVDSFFIQFPRTARANTTLIHSSHF